jgi:hypothetical protein
MMQRHYDRRYRRKVRNAADIAALERIING